MQCASSITNPRTAILYTLEVSTFLHFRESNDSGEKKLIDTLQYRFHPSFLHIRHHLLHKQILLKVPLIGNISPGAIIIQSVCIVN